MSLSSTWQHQQKQAISNCIFPISISFTSSFMRNRLMELRKKLSHFSFHSSSHGMKSTRAHTTPLSITLIVAGEGNKFVEICAALMIKYDFERRSTGRYSNVRFQGITNNYPTVHTSVGREIDSFVVMIVERVFACHLLQAKASNALCGFLQFYALHSIPTSLFSGVYRFLIESSM